MPETSLEPLITECPSCHTRFRVNESQLGMAGGRVRCGACLFVFLATDYLVLGSAASQRQSTSQAELDQLLEELASNVPKPVPAAPRAPENAPSTLPAAPPPGAEKAEPSASVAVAAPFDARVESKVEEIVVEGVPETESVPSEPVPIARAAIVPQQADSAAPALPEPAAATPTPPPAEAASEPPVAPRRDRRRRRQAGAVRQVPAPRIGDLSEAPVAPAAVATKRRRWWLPFAVLLAALGLVAQVLWFQFDIWSRDLQFRPIYERICPYVGCRLPVLRALEAMHSRNLVVRSHPDVAGALLVDALLVNEAPYPQPFPLIELRFSSMAGQLVAGRRFKPSEYLAGELRGATMIEPMTPVHISLEIEDPGADAVNYVMVFR